MLYYIIKLSEQVKIADKTKYGEADTIGILVSTEDLKKLKVRQCHRCQLHQPSGAKRKCDRRTEFHQQNIIQLYQYTQIEVTPNFYPVNSAPYASKFSIKSTGTKAAHKVMVKLTPSRLKNVSAEDNFRKRIWSYKFGV